MLPEVGKTGSLSSIRKYLQKDCNMLQVWAGKTPEDDDYVTFICQDLEHYAVIKSAATTRDYVIMISGEIVYLHEKNLFRLAEEAAKN